MTTRGSLLSALAGFGRKKLHAPLAEDDLAEMERGIQRKVPGSLRIFLSMISNGAELNQFILFPCATALVDRKEAKWLWNSLQRNNSAKTAPWFDRDEETFSNFIVFASDGAACFCMPYEEEDPSVWIWEAGGDEVLELDYRLDEWLTESSRHDPFGGNGSIVDSQ